MEGGILLDHLLDNAVEPILTIDRDGTLLTVSRAALRLFGYRRSEMVGKHARMLLPEDHRSLYEEHVARFLAKAGPIAAEGPREVDLVHRDGLSLRVDISIVQCTQDRKNVYVAMLRDASERTAMQEELQRERDFADRVIDTAPMLVRVIDRQGRLMRANEGLAELLGMSSKKMFGKEWAATFMDQEDRAPFSDHLTQLTNGERTSSTHVSPLRTGDGRTRRVRWHNSPLREGDEIVGVLSIGLDVTDAQRTEELLMRSQKMEAVGRLTGGIAHDFNNLLMGVLGCCKQALARLDSAHAARPFLEEIAQSAHRSVQLTRRLLTFSRREPTARCVVDLTQCVRSIASFARQLIGEDITLSTRFACANALVEGDPTQIEQVLMNLVVNARDAMPNGGSLSIRVSADTTPTPLAAAGQVVLEVEDTGCGMSAEVQERIFEPFFTTKPQGQGTGLGLATVFGIVSRMHGQIAVDSAPGLGSRFCITLPRTTNTDAACPDARSEGDSKTVRGNGETVLLVEDEAIVRMSLQGALQELGYKTIVAADAAQALDAIEKGARFDLLLTDVVLPGVCGPELARIVRLAAPTVRVLFMSAHAHEHLVQQGKLRQEDLSLEKPFTQEVLSQKLRATLEVGTR